MSTSGICGCKRKEADIVRKQHEDEAGILCYACPIHYVPVSIDHIRGRVFESPVIREKLKELIREAESGAV